MKLFSRPFEKVSHARPGLIRGFLRAWILASALVLTQQNVHAQTTNESLLPFAVDIHLSTMNKTWTGHGIYLGNGFFITAAHVVGKAWITNPKIALAGQEYPTLVVKEGSFEGTDLTLLAVDNKALPSRLGLRRTTLCKTPSQPGQQVATVIPSEVVRSHIVDPKRLPLETRRFSTAIADVARTGNSGSGVFDVREKCLIGIMSRKISRSLTRAGKTETHDIAKYFVPASEIATFLPASALP